MQTDDEDWDVDEARERRRALLPQFENRPNVHQTEDDVLSQYKRKLAALERSLESPVKPAAKSMHRREQTPANCAVVCFGEHQAAMIFSIATCT